MAIKNVQIAKIAANTPDLPYKMPKGGCFRNGDATPVSVTGKDMYGNTIVINAVQSGQVTDWVGLSEITSTTATNWEAYKWD